MTRLQEEYLNSGRAKLFEHLRGCLAQDESVLPYAEIAARLNLTEAAVKMAVHRLRARYREILHAEIAERYDRILTFADIGDFLEVPVKAYSSGMLMRLAFATAINIDPQILVVDEALAVGDARFVARCMTQLRRLQDDGASGFVESWKELLGAIETKSKALS